MRNNYQTKEQKSNHKFEVVGEQELMVGLPLPMAEVWAELEHPSIQLSIGEPMNKKAASQHACPFHNISEDSGGTCN